LRPETSQAYVKLTVLVQQITLIVSTDLLDLLSQIRPDLRAEPTANTKSQEVTVAGQLTQLLALVPNDTAVAIKRYFGKDDIGLIVDQLSHNGAPLCREQIIGIVKMDVVASASVKEYVATVGWTAEHFSPNNSQVQAIRYVRSRGSGRSIVIYPNFIRPISSMH
jgi:hypothetical protein